MIQVTGCLSPDARGDTGEKQQPWGAADRPQWGDPFNTQLLYPHGKWGPQQALPKTRVHMDFVILFQTSNHTSLGSSSPYISSRAPTCPANAQEHTSLLSSPRTQPQDTQSQAGSAKQDPAQLPAGATGATGPISLHCEIWGRHRCCTEHKCKERN